MNNGNEQQQQQQLRQLRKKNLKSFNPMATELKFFFGAPVCLTFWMADFSFRIFFHGLLFKCLNVTSVMLQQIPFTNLIKLKQEKKKNQMCHRVSCG